ncbi:hypothetical protein HS088_TW21G01225 [Tripterygium wilfordii]|uniref:Uncharacterized protein n=1 Tax=Tripterygium wilfordii TaxID=458696 RepID=A0A7J7C4N0_TRIWF|nr:hypothetical protein HS088_TW21G01225 [Tripterygium wilfordii]
MYQHRWNIDGRVGFTRFGVRICSLEFFWARVLVYCYPVFCMWQMKSQILSLWSEYQKFLFLQVSSPPICIGNGRIYIVYCSLAIELHHGVRKRQEIRKTPEQETQPYSCKSVARSQKYIL